VINVFSRLFSERKKVDDISDLMMTPFEAVEELKRRRSDPTLQKKIEEYLKDDLPEYFKAGPILYIARYIVTPNFETLRFVHLMKDLGLDTVASYDSKGLFVSQNQVKRALCKLPICHRVTQKKGKLNEQYENVSIVDFNSADGKPFCDIKTIWGEGLIDFHTRLFSELKTRKIHTPDDAPWIDRHHRGDLLSHYKKLLALFVVHGVFLENYNTDDEHEVILLRDILRPACRFVEERFGYRPLITQIFPTPFESHHFWISYPRSVLKVVQQSMPKQHLHTSKTSLPFSV
jgi:hypothetical protein